MGSANFEFVIPRNEGSAVIIALIHYFVATLNIISTYQRYLPDYWQLIKNIRSDAS